MEEQAAYVVPGEIQKPKTTAEKLREAAWGKPADCIELVAAVELEQLREKYSELIMAVCARFPDETRHETALRYIRDREALRGAQEVACHDPNALQLGAAARAAGIVR